MSEEDFGTGIKGNPTCTWVNGTVNTGTPALKELEVRSRLPSCTTEWDSRKELVGYQVGRGKGENETGKTVREEPEKGKYRGRNRETVDRR